jgi:hypothetical protein
VDLVEIGERAMAMGGVADRADRRDVAIHRIDRFEGHDLGRRRIGAGQQFLEMGHVIVAEDPAHGARVADAGDHRGVVQRIGIELAARQQGAQGLQGGLVGDIARGEDEGGFLEVQRRQLALEGGVQRIGAGDVARAAGARALRIDRPAHRLDDGGMLAHGEIVVAAPHRHVARLLAFAMQARAREGADDPLQLGEHAVAAFVVQTAKVAREKCLVIHSVVVSRTLILVGSASFPQTHFGRGLPAGGDTKA